MWSVASSLKCKLPRKRNGAPLSPERSSVTTGAVPLVAMIELKNLHPAPDVPSASATVTPPSQQRLKPSPPPWFGLLAELLADDPQVIVFVVPDATVCHVTAPCANNAQQNAATPTSLNPMLFISSHSLSRFNFWHYTKNPPRRACIFGQKKCSISQSDKA